MTEMTEKDELQRDYDQLVKEYDELRLAAFNAIKTMSTILIPNYFIESDIHQESMEAITKLAKALMY